MLRRRNCLFFGTGLGLALVNGCWVGSNSDPGPLVSFGTAGGAANVSGAPSTSAGAPSAGAANAGAPQGGGGGAAAAGAPSGGAPAGGAPAGGATGMAGAPTAGAGGAGACPAPSTTAHQTTALDRSCWKAAASDCSTSAANPNPPKLALDGMTTTRFSTGLKMSAQTAPFTYQVDLGSSVMISGIAVNSSVSTDAAPQLKVEVSTNGTTWTAVACGDGMTITDFSFAPVAAQHVRLTQSGTSNTGWWSIHELNVYGATATDKACPTPGTGPTGEAAACTTPHAT